MQTTDDLRPHTPDCWHAAFTWAGVRHAHPLGRQINWDRSGQSYHRSVPDDSSHGTRPHQKSKPWIEDIPHHQYERGAAIRCFLNALMIQTMPNASRFLGCSKTFRTAGLEGEGQSQYLFTEKLKWVEIR